jgi:hypothetical protein
MSANLLNPANLIDAYGRARPPGAPRRSDGPAGRPLQIAGSELARDPEEIIARKPTYSAQGLEPLVTSRIYAVTFSAF